MWPFKTKEYNTGESAPQSPIPSEAAITAVVSLSSAPSWNVTYETYAREGWKKNPTIRACIKIKGRALGRLPLRVFTTADDGSEKPLDNHPVWDILKRPNKKQTWAMFCRELQIHADLCGEAFVLRLGAANLPSELRLIRPDRITVEHTTTDVTGYTYLKNTQWAKLYSPEEICHIRFESALDDWRGESPLTAAAVSGDLENNGLDWNSSLLKNLAVPSVVFEGEAGTFLPEPEDQKRIEEKFKEKYAGKDKAGTVAFLAGGFKVKEIGYSPKDMDWLQGMIGAQIRIAIVLGVPPELIGIQGQKTYSNYIEARRSFYEETILPDADEILNSITAFLQPMGGDQGFQIGVDLSKVSAIQEAQGDHWTRSKEAFQAGGMDLGEYCSELGTAAPEDDVKSLRILPSGFMPLADIAATDATAGEPNPATGAGAGDQPQPGMDPNATGA
jgi:HK97 family phage portal protein